ncbi:OsmC family protein [Kitasatospora cathayae]|uniref:OsmC family protein n=1 Tax=Kitasatospora cathayae TaxID=3004092 RepID=A0ABY7PWU2_9ACTN|nr:OsmC family protein [Kitasatospora sp. HUAS 3-15]WBP84902.1 OsmC family protein [Kitasatospora sp. HUAS 3-15]
MLTDEPRTTTQQLMHTACGRTLAVSRFTPEVLPDSGRVVLDTLCEPYDTDQVWVSLTPAEARQLAGMLLRQAAAVDRPRTARPGRIEVDPVAGDLYAIGVRSHSLAVDQPTDAGGADAAPTPVELCASALASCTAHYAGGYLDRHDLSRGGLHVSADYTMAQDRPARIASVSIEVTAPGLPPEREAGLLAVVRHCTVKNTLDRPPDVRVSLNGIRRAGAS